MTEEKKKEEKKGIYIIIPTYRIINIFAKFEVNIYK